MERAAQPSVTSVNSRSTAARRVPQDTGAQKSDLSVFFAEVGSRLTQEGEPSQFPDQKELEHFFKAISRRVKDAEKKQRQLDLKEATRFNVFDLIDPDENKLSDILADLLNPAGSHGQGALFLHSLFEQLEQGLGSDANLTKNLTVQREAPTHGIQKYRRRMDVLVKAGALLAIENKLDSPEQRDQVKDYLVHLRFCTRGSHRKSVLIYLTPEHRRPDSLTRGEFNDAEAKGILHCWSYQQEIREWLQNCRQKCHAEKVKIFLTDFITHIETHLKPEPETDTET